MEKYTIINERLKNVLHYLMLVGKVKNATDFSVKTGHTKATICNITTAKRNVMTMKSIRRFVEPFPELRPRYLVDENCKEMLTYYDDLLDMFPRLTKKPIE